MAIVHRDRVAEGIGHPVTRRILFTGDSITRGRLGVGYLRLLGKRFPGYELVNLGRDGDTLLGIKARTLAHLAGSHSYDLLVIVAGHNDVILPAFEQRSFVHRAVARQTARRGSVPAPDYESFLSTYRAFVEAIRSGAGIPVVVTTLSCINEAPAGSTAERRRLYNHGIRDLAQEMAMGLADVGAEFDQVLGVRECRDYFLPNPAATVLFDTWKSRTVAGADALSAARRLHLTIDGVHLNSRGAHIYADAVGSFLIDVPPLVET